MGPGPQQPDTKNLILAFAISMMILLGFQTFYAGPQEEARRAELAKQEQLQPKTSSGVTGSSPAATAAAVAPVPRAEALTRVPRVAIEAGAVKGSISLVGARIDDLVLLRYKQEVGGKDPVVLMQPQGTEHAQYAVFGWREAGGGAAVMPGPDTLWTAPAGAKLTPATPLTLTFTSPAGLTFTRVIKVDYDYLFTFTDTVANTGATAVTLQPYGLINRHRSESDRVDPVNHQGAATLFDNSLKKATYKQIEEGKGPKIAQATGGWLGFKDRYWLATLIPDQTRTVTAEVKTELQADGMAYQAAYASQPMAVPAGGAITLTQHLYAGGKARGILDRYATELNVNRLDDSIDWGRLKVLTKPLHSLMLFFNGHIHNIGLSILAITVVIKLLTFPLVYTSYRSFAKLRDLSPKMKDIQTRFAEDKARQQQEMIKLYQTEKINPVAGCIPVLLQMPIFFALFKVLSISIELRHAPFFGWVNDLSSRDPTTIFNLFGLLPFDPAAVPLIGGVISTGFLAIGIWPILYGASFALLQKMQPSNVTDPMQAKIFALMPWMFCFIFAGFSSGLVIYYTWSNLLTIVQQYAIAKSMKSSNPIDEFFAKLSKGKAKT